MEFFHFLLFSCLSVAFVASHAAVSPADYWKSVLPNTPMPNAITQLLHPEVSEDKVNTKGTYVVVGNGGVGVGVGTGKLDDVVVGKGTGVGVVTGRPGKGANVDVGRRFRYKYAATPDQLQDSPNVDVGRRFHYNYGPTADQLQDSPNVDVGRRFKYKYAATADQLQDSPNVDVGRRFRYKYAATPDQLQDSPNVDVGRRFHYNYGPTADQLQDSPNVDVGRRFKYKYAATADQLQDSPNVDVGRRFRYKYAATPDQLQDSPNVDIGRRFRYHYAATADQLQDSPKVALFFLEKDMKKDTEMNLHFTKTVNSATFLPRQVSEKIPFSSESLPEILNQFSVKPESAEAETIKKTVQECEEPGNEGEEKYCATSLESMVDFTTSKLGKKVNAVSTEVDKVTQPQKYSIQGVKKIGNDKAVVCHKQSYVYGVFYCHKTQKTRTYLVALAGGDGTKAKAVAVCHTDTAGWNPKHLAFQVLKVKPGSVPICHFLPEDHVVWVPEDHVVQYSSV